MTHFFSCDNKHSNPLREQWGVGSAFSFRLSWWIPPMNPYSLLLDFGEKVGYAKSKNNNFFLGGMYF